MRIGTRQVFFLCLLAHLAASWAGVPDLRDEVAYHARIKDLGGRFTHIAVIGGGCAGLSAGFEAAYLRYPVVVFTGHRPGGQLMGSQLVENIPGMSAMAGYQVIEQLQAQAEKAGARIIYETVINMQYECVGGLPLFILTTEESEGAPQKRWCCMSVVCAMGGVPKLLEIPGEASYLNKQIFTCALCDGRVAEGKDVYVVGGGDASIDTIMTLLGFGARSCTLLVRSDKLRAAPALQQRLQQRAPGEVTILYHTKIDEIKGDAERMHTIVLEDRAGKRELSAELLFYAIGHKPMTQLPWVRRHVQCDEQGYIIVNRAQATHFPGIFAAGDVASPWYHQAAYAMGCAPYAVTSAVEFCEGYLTPSLRTLLTEYVL